MGDFPQSGGIATPTHLPSISQFSGAYSAQAIVETATIASMASPGEKVAAFIPCFLPWPYPVARAFWVNGSAAGGNVDVGAYTKEGTRIFSTGATAATGNNEIQYVDVTDLLLPAGLFYMAIVNDSATTANRLFGLSNITANPGRMGGLVQMAAASPLPSTATFAAWATSGLPIFGFTKTASGF